MRIFISYRRDDSAGYAGRLYDHLSARFGENQVFMDVAGIQPGQDFVEALEQEVNRCDALLAIIGRQWLTITGEAGQRRLDEALDFVRLEIAAALGRNILVIPVLVDNAAMPAADALPDPLKKLARRNAISLSLDRFRHDMERLIGALEHTSTPTLPPDASIAGQWLDRERKIHTFFRQQGARVVGFYTMEEMKLGTYLGEVIGAVFEFKWRWLNIALGSDQPLRIEGEGRTILAPNRQRMTGHYWVGESQNNLLSLNAEWLGSTMPAWISAADFAPFKAYLDGTG